MKPREKKQPSASHKLFEPQALIEASPYLAAQPMPSHLQAMYESALKHFDKGKRSDA